MGYYIILLIVLIFFSAFFSSAEVAFLSLSEAKLSVLANEKRRNSRMIIKLKSDPRSLLVTILIGNNIVNISAASLATVVFSHYFDSAVIGITTGIMTAVILIFGEIIPKAFASSKALSLARLWAGPLTFLKIVFSPIIVIMNTITNILVGKHQSEKISEEELKALAMTGVEQGTIDRSEGVMIENLFSLNNITAEDIMTPRVEIVYVLEGDSIEKCAEEIERFGTTRCLVVDNNPDKVKGFVHAQDVLLAFRQGRENDKVSSLIRPIAFVPKQMIVSSILKELQRRKMHIAVVMDEYGGTDGIVTLEDILEELVGEIIDEHDVDDTLIKRIGKNEIMVSGITEARDINRFLNINISDNGLDTIADIILNQIKKIPKEGMKIKVKDYECTIKKVENRVIKLVNIRK
ncbi:MAG: hemolysin family protein [Patescibacteria group bacterium]|jgi:putative hemolysin|nr:hemolysin family protein [Patescibacteria group bacterium]